MQHIGITGGIGSGKTTVCHVFEQFGIPVYYADERAKLLADTDPDTIKALIAAFGAAVYLPQGTLNRAYLASIVFADAAKLAQLNAITHPRVFADVAAWQAAQTGCAYTVKEAAILIESGGYKAVDKVIVVTAPLELRMARVLARDAAADRTMVMARMAQQLTDAEKLKFADFVIVNDGRQPLVPQVWEIHQQIKAALDAGKAK